MSMLLIYEMIQDEDTTPIVMPNDNGFANLVAFLVFLFMLSLETHISAESVLPWRTTCVGFLIFWTTLFNVAAGHSLSSWFAVTTEPMFGIAAASHRILSSFRKHLVAGFDMTRLSIARVKKAVLPVLAFFQALTRCLLAKNHRDIDINLLMFRMPSLPPAVPWVGREPSTIPGAFLVSPPATPVAVVAPDDTEGNLSHISNPFTRALIRKEEALAARRKAAKDAEWIKRSKLSSLAAMFSSSTKTVQQDLSKQDILVPATIGSPADSAQVLPRSTTPMRSGKVPGSLSLARAAQAQEPEPSLLLAQAYRLSLSTRLSRVASPSVAVRDQSMSQTRFPRISSSLATQLRLSTNPNRQSATTSAANKQFLPSRQPAWNSWASQRSFPLQTGALQSPSPGPWVDPFPAMTEACKRTQAEKEKQRQENEQMQLFVEQLEAREKAATASNPAGPAWLLEHIPEAQAAFSAAGMTEGFPNWFPFLTCDDRVQVLYAIQANADLSGVAAKAQRAFDNKHFDVTGHLRFDDLQASLPQPQIIVEPPKTNPNTILNGTAGISSGSGKRSCTGAGIGASTTPGYNTGTAAGTFSTSALPGSGNKSPFTGLSVTTPSINQRSSSGKCMPKSTSGNSGAGGRKVSRNNGPIGFVVV